MKLAIGRLASIFITAGGLLLAGARGVLDLVGYSTAPEDIAVAQTRLAQLFDWFLSIPWWAVWGFALVCTLWLIWVSWPRHQKHTHTAAPKVTSRDDPVNSPQAGPEVALEIISSQDFKDKHVLMDGRHFVNCTFKDCVVEYNGGPFQITECRMTPSRIRLVTRNQIVIKTLSVLRGIGFMKENVSGTEFPEKPQDMQLASFRKHTED